MTSNAGQGGDWQPPTRSDWEHVANGICPRCHAELDTRWWECTDCGFNAKKIALSEAPPSPTSNSDEDGR